MAGWQDALAARASALWRLSVPAAPLAVKSRKEAEASAEAALGTLGWQKGDVRVRHLELRCSATRLVRAHLFEPLRGSLDCHEPRCAVVYCPSESSGGGSSEEVQPLVRDLLPLRVAVLALDVSNTHCTFCEVADVQSAVALLRSDEEGFERVALWGRSAGAVTALRCAEQDPTLAALICDGAYTDLPSLLGLPTWVSSPLWGLRRWASNVPTVACGAPASASGGRGQSANSSVGGGGLNLNLGAIPVGQAPLEVASRCFVPAVFLHGADDSEVPAEHSRALRDAYGGEGQFLLVAGCTHDSARSEASLAKAVLFLCRAFSRGDGAQTLREGVAALERRARAAAQAPPVAATCFMALTEAEIDALLTSEDVRSRRQGLLLASVAAVPSHRGARFHAVALPSRSRSDGPLWQLSAEALLPRAESEVAIAWAVSAKKAGTGGSVHFAVISPSVASLTEVRLVPQEAALEEPQSPESRSSATRRLAVRVETLALVEVELTPGAQPHPLRLVLRDDGGCELVVGDRRLSRMGRATGGLSLEKEGQAPSAAFSLYSATDPGMSLWTSGGAPAADAEDLAKVEFSLPVFGGAVWRESAPAKPKEVQPHHPSVGAQAQKQEGCSPQASGGPSGAARASPAPLRPPAADTAIEAEAMTCLAPRAGEPPLTEKTSPGPLRPAQAVTFQDSPDGDLSASKQTSPIAVPLTEEASSPAPPDSGGSPGTERLSPTTARPAQAFALPQLPLEVLRENCAYISPRQQTFLSCSSLQLTRQADTLSMTLSDTSTLALDDLGQCSPSASPTSRRRGTRSMTEMPTVLEQDIATLPPDDEPPSTLGTLLPQPWGQPGADLHGETWPVKVERRHNRKSSWGTPGEF